MIESLIPGVRDTRSEFASGALFVAWIWLTAGHLIRTAVDGNTETNLQVLLDSLDRPAAIALIAATAFVLGAIWTSVIERALGQMWRRHLRSAVPAGEHLAATRRVDSPYTYTSLRRMDAFLNRSAKEWITDSELHGDWKAKVMWEAIYAAPAVLSNSDKAGNVSAIYSEYTRRKAGGELRLAIALPLTGVAAALAWQVASHPLLAVLGIAGSLLVGAGMLATGRQGLRHANSQLAHLVATGKITSANMDLAKMGLYDGTPRRGPSKVPAAKQR